MRLIFDQFGLVVLACPAVVFGQIDDIAFDQSVGGDDFGGERSGSCAGLVQLKGDLGCLPGGKPQQNDSRA